MNWKYIVTALVVAYVAALLYFAVTPGLAGIRQVGENDKLLHFSEFLIFAALLVKTLSYYDIKRLYVTTITVSVIIIVASELIQTLSPSRQFSYLDMVADALGVLMALVVYRWTHYKR